MAKKRNPPEGLPLPPVPAKERLALDTRDCGDINPLKKLRGGEMAAKVPDLELDDQRHFLNLLPAWMQQLVAMLPDANFLMSESELLEYVFPAPKWEPPEGQYVSKSGLIFNKDGENLPPLKRGTRKGSVKGTKNEPIRVPKYKSEPTSIAVKLRAQIWDEYDRVQRIKIDTINTNYVIKGVCNFSYFVHRFCADKKLLTWLIYPPVSYKRAMGDILEMGIRQLKDIMALQHIDERGNVNAKLCDIKFKIMQHVDMRLKGAIIQRIDQRNVNVNVDATKEEVGIVEKKVMTMEEIDLRLEQINRETKLLSSPGVLDPDIIGNLKPVVLTDKEAVELKEKTMRDLNAKARGRQIKRKTKGKSAGKAEKVNN